MVSEKFSKGEAALRRSRRVDVWVELKHIIDLSTKLRSLPARFGIGRALWIARALHAGAFAALLALYFLTALG
ncbi:MAG: hypothetical protein LC775_03595, partial [Acidobacteria bacterium]|nr:hypothetical protein [Acidobacteriota bacterium]